MKYGYARVSTLDQNFRLQLDALRKAGCERISREKQSAVKHRPQLEALLLKLKPGDELIVYRLDRLARSLKHLLLILDRLAEQGVSLRSLTEPIDTSTPVGRMIVQMLAVVAEFERGLIRERTLAGSAANVRRGGSPGGRPAKLSEAESSAVRKRYAEGGVSLSELGREYGVSHMTIYDRVRPRKRERMPVLRKYL